MTMNPKDTLETVDMSGARKQLWARDFLNTRIRKKVSYDADGNPIEIWFYDYDCFRVKKIIILWDHGNPVEVLKEIVTKEDWKERWGEYP